MATSGPILRAGGRQSCAMVRVLMKGEKCCHYNKRGEMREKVERMKDFILVCS